MNRTELQRIIQEKLNYYRDFTISGHVLEEALDDPNVVPIGAFGISMNEAMLLAGGRPAKSNVELFEQWCADNGIEWTESPLGFDRTFCKSTKERMRDFLVKIAAQALRWPDVESVEIGLETPLRFENNGHNERNAYNGVVRLRLLGGKHFGYVFTSYAVEKVRDTDMLIQDMRRAFDMPVKEAQL